MFELASAYRDNGMLGYSQLQQREFSRSGRLPRGQAPVLRRHRLFRRRSTAISAGHIPQAPWRKYGNRQFTAPAAKSAPQRDVAYTEG